MAAIMLCLTAAPAAAQDFVTAVPAMGDGPLSLIEHGIAGSPAPLMVESGVVRWLGLDDLVTRAVAGSARWSRLNSAAGVSATGEDVGWRSAGIASGYTSATSGAALRAVLRREGSAEAIETALGPGTGLEAGAGAWIGPRAGLQVWASHPQIVVRGAAPPLRRGLETGLRFAGESLSAWLARQSAAGRDVRHRIGLGLDLGTVVTAWAEARDDPLRAGYGIEARSKLVAVAFALEIHPVLGETARLSLAIGANDGAAPAP